VLITIANRTAKIKNQFDDGGKMSFVVFRRKTQSDQVKIL
jgi:hypothetical protein